MSYLESLPHGMQLLLPLVHIALLIRVGRPHSEHKARNKQRSGQDDLTEHKGRDNNRSGQVTLTLNTMQKTTSRGQDRTTSLNTRQETGQDRMTSF